MQLTLDITEARTEELIRLLPREATYVRDFKPQPSELDLPLEAMFYAEASQDPQLGFQFVSAFAQVRKPLPEEIYEAELLRAYNYLRFHGRDRDVEAALSLEPEPNRRKRLLVRSMLLRPECSYALVGDSTGLTEAAVSIYHALFWPVRGKHPLYVNSLVYPRGRLVEFAPGFAEQESEEHLVYRLAIHYSLAVVEEFLGLRPLAILAPGEAADRVLAQTLSTANFAARVGFVHQDLPIFKRAFAALRLMNSKRRTQQPVESQDASVTNTALALSRTLHRNIPERAWLSRPPMPVVRTTSSDASGCEAVPPEPPATILSKLNFCQPHSVFGE